MRYWSWLVFICSMILPCSSPGQILRSTPSPYKACEFKPIYSVAENDSLRKRVILDSISILLAGRWQLVVEGAGDCFVPSHAPNQFTEMILDGQGYGAVYQGNKLLTDFQIRLSFYSSQVHFVMEETRKPAYFQFFPSFLDKTAKNYYKPTTPFAYAYKNKLRVCEETLHLYGPRTGLSFVFKRLPSRYGPEP